FRADRIGPHHALASAAIPLLFPPVRIDGELHLDGGLRQNTPIAPALRLGATHIFAIGSSREVSGRVVREAGHVETGRAPGAAFLLGKVLNAFLLDHVDVDIELLTRINNVLVDGTRSYGAGFPEALTSEARKRGALEYRYVNCMRVRPSEDIGRLANDHLKRGRLRGDPILTKKLFNMLDLGVRSEADLASYLLFDGPFCRKLIEMGRADAQARRDELVEFFREVRDEPGGTPEEPEDSTERFGRDLLPLGSWACGFTRSGSGTRVSFLRGAPSSGAAGVGCRYRNSSTSPAPSRTISGGLVVRSMTDVGDSPPAPPSSTRASPLNAESSSSGSTKGASPGRAAVDEMIGRPSSRASARVTSQAGTRMPTFLRFICTSFGTSRVAGRMN